MPNDVRASWVVTKKGRKKYHHVYTAWLNSNIPSFDFQVLSNWFGISSFDAVKVDTVKRNLYPKPSSNPSLLTWSHIWRSNTTWYLMFDCAVTR